MTINQIQPDNQPLDSARLPVHGAGAANQVSTKKTTSQQVAPQEKDASDVSKLSRMLAKAAQDINKESEIRPAKLALARTLIEKGDPLSDRDIDATWDKMLPLV